MNSEIGERYTAELIKLFDQEHEVLYGGQHSLCLTVACVQYLQRKFAQLHETLGSSVPSLLVCYQQLRDHFSRIKSLKLITDRNYPPLTRNSIITLNLEPFRALQSLIFKKIPLNLVIGLQSLRGQLRVLIVQRCEVEDLDDIIVRCGGDNSTSLAWSNLKELDLSNNMIMKLSDSLQYLLCLEKVNFSNNMVGKRPRVSAEPSGSGTDNSNSPAVVMPDQSGQVSLLNATEGIESIDNVHFLHLGFNKLRQVPKFGSRAKYMLRVLNLRNNELVIIDGLEELDNLVDLDLTDNLLSRHSSLQPFQNLHHLSLLSLQGNPLSFHPKHRLKTAENLSNLIDRNSFKLDGKKLSSVEKKVVPISMTHHFSSLSSSGTSRTRAIDASLNSTDVSITHSLPSVHGILTDSETVYGAGNKRMLFTSAQQQNGPLPTKPHKKSKRVAKIIDSDDESKERHGGHVAKIVDSDEEKKTSGSVSDKIIYEDFVRSRHGQIKGSRRSRRRKKREKQEELLVSGSVPLIHEQELNKHKDMRLQTSDNWLQVSLDKSPPATDNDRLSSQVDKNSNSLSPNSSDNSSKKSRHSSDKGRESEKSPPGQPKDGTKKEVLVDVVLNDCEGDFGPKTSSPQKESPLDISGDHYFVERYESDVEEERVNVVEKENSKDQVIVRLSNGFLEECDVNLKPLDRWDLHCLKDVSIDSRFWKSTAEKREVLFLQFNIARSDRRRREYVLLEEGAGESIMEILKPIVEQNESTFSIGSGIECLQCQRVFDKAQAIEQPSDIPEPLRTNSSYRGRSISQLMCPFCHSQILQQSMPRSFPKVGSSTGSRFGSASPIHHTASNATSSCTLHTFNTNIQSGFSITTTEQDKSRTSPSNLAKVAITENIQGNESLDPLKSIHRTQILSNNEDSNCIGEGKNSSDGKEEEYDVFNGRCSYSNDAKTHRSKINQDSPVETDYLKGLTEEAFTETEPITLPLRSGKDEDKINPLDSDEAHFHEGHPSIFEDTMDPWKADKKPMNPFYDPDFQRAALKSSNKDKVIKANSGSHERVRVYDDEEKGGFGGWTRKDGSGFLHQDSSSSPYDDDSYKNQYDYGYGEPEPNASSSVINIPPHLVSQKKRPTNDSLNPTGLEYSTSMPAHESIHSNFSRPSINQDTDDRPVKDMDRQKNSSVLGHSRSRSMDYHPVKSYNTSPTGKRKRYIDPFEIGIAPVKVQGSNRSLESVKEEENHTSKSSKSSRSSSRRSSMYSPDSDSPSWHSDAHSVSQSPKNQSHNSLARDYSSAECNQPTSRRNTSSRRSKFWAQLGSDMHSSSNTSPAKPPQLSKLPLEVSPNKKRLQERSNGKSRSDTGSGDSSQLKSPRSAHSHHSSSDGAGKKKTFSPLVICKDDDPSYIDNNLNLYLDMEVFDTTKGEIFKMIFRSTVVQYSEPEEFLVLVVISNLHAYLFQIIAPESSRPKKWLNLACKHSLRKLVYIDHGVAYQFLRVEFKSAGACYTFLMRDSDKCKLCSTQLSLCVADAPGSSLRNVGVCPFSIDSLRYPNRVLDEVIKTHYGTSSAGISPTNSLSWPSSTQPPIAEDLVLYRLAYRYRHQTGGCSPVTLVVTSNTLFLAKENFAHWPLPRMQKLPPLESLLPPFLDVEQRDITDVEKILMDRDEVKFIIIRFFDESSFNGNSRQWKLILQGPECVKKLATAIKTSWEREFQTSLEVLYK